MPANGLPCGSGRAEGLGVVGSVQIGYKGGNEYCARLTELHDSAVRIAG